MSDLERLRAVDSRVFGKDWWRQPLSARFASVDAHVAGLLVQVEVMRRPQQGDEAPCITWRGTSAQFRATQTFPNGVAAKRSTGRYVYPNQLRGTVYPDGEDRFLFVIEFCNDFPSRSYFARHAQQALTDPNYHNFRSALVAGGLAGELDLS